MSAATCSPQRRALLLMDFINEIVHSDGKYAGDGFYEQVNRNRVLDNAARALARARASGIPVIHVIVGFSRDYIEWPPNSPIFAHARDGGRIIFGSWGTEIHAKLTPLKHEPVIAKSRISPFFGTGLEILLGQLGVDTLVLGGVDTKFVVLSTAVDGHDRDYNIVVLKDATASSSEQGHENALSIIESYGRVSTVDAEFPEESA